MIQLQLTTVPTLGPTQYFRSDLTGTVFTFAQACDLMSLVGNSATSVADLDAEFEPVHVHLLGPRQMGPQAVLLGKYQIYASTDTSLGVNPLPDELASLASEDYEDTPTINALEVGR